MKILLLTDLPPCDDFTAGLVLSAMARFVPTGSLCCFAVVNPTIPVRLSPEFSGVPIEFHLKPNENWKWIPRRRPFGRAANVLVNAGERLAQFRSVTPLIENAVAFGRAQGVDRVWAVLEGQTLIRMAEPVANRLGVPLHTQVWDPFSWWAKANRLDGHTTRSVQATFDCAVTHSRAVATASQPMADSYRERFGAHALPVIASHAESLAKAPRPRLASDGTLLIGMAGQFYSATEWLSLIDAMFLANWRVAGKEVRIVVMGPQVPPGMDDSRITFLGWKTQGEAAEILSCCDLLYCPYPFDPGMKEVSQFSFPSKLVLYLAAGRPIVFQGPDYSAPAAYVRDNNCGVVADQPFATSIYNAIEWLVLTPDAYKTSAEGAQRAFMRDFTLQSMQRAFSEFLDLGAPMDTIRMYSHAGSSVPYDDRLSDEIRNRSLPVMAVKTGRKGREIGRAVKRLVGRSATNLALRIPRLKALKLESHSLYAEISHLRRQLAEAHQKLAILATSENASAMGIVPAAKIAAAGQAYRGKRPLLFGRADLIRHLPLATSLDEHGSSAAGRGDVALLFYLAEKTAISRPILVDEAGHSTEPSAYGSDADGGLKIATLLRLALRHRVDEIVAAGDDEADPNVSVVLHIAALLKLAATVATRSGGSLSAEGSLPDNLIFRTLQSYNDVEQRKDSAPH